MNKSKLANTAYITLVLGIGLAGAGLLNGAGSGWGGSSSEAPSPGNKQTEASSLYQQGIEEVKKNNYSGALEAFTKAAKKDKNNPDILNMLAYTQRKSGMLEEAFKNYGRALELRPKFPQAREYLGEAHIQAALKELDTLKSYGAEGEKDYSRLKAAFQEAAAKL